MPMPISAIPAFTASQSDTHIHLVVEAEAACSSDCSPRAVVDNGSVFGLACSHSHLPLVFPNDTLVDGAAKMGETGSSSAISLTRVKSKINVQLLKRQAKSSVEGLKDLRPSVFPLLEHDEEGQNEERLLGLEMLQRGMDAMKSSPALDRNQEGSSSKASLSTPRPPQVSKEAKTRVHEYVGDVAQYDGSEERTIRRVAAYEAEEKHWDEGMYLDNYVDEDGQVKHLLEAVLQPPPEPGNRVHSTVSITRTPVLEKDLSLLLLELLLAQMYDHRTTLGEATVESAWTIAVLCRSLVTSCLPSTAAGDTVASILIGAVRRQLSFPLYRNWNLSMKVVEDVVNAIRQQQALCMLSHIHRLFEQGEDEAMSVYLADVVAPLVESFDSFFSAALLALLADQVESAINVITKSQVGGNWDMEELEVAAQEAMEEGEGGYI